MGLGVGFVERWKKSMISLKNVNTFILYKKTGLKKFWCKIKSFGKYKMKIFGVKRYRESEKEERAVKRNKSLWVFKQN